MMLLHIADKTFKKDIFLHRNTLSSFLLVRSVKQGSSGSPIISMGSILVTITLKKHTRVTVARDITVEMLIT